MLPISLQIEERWYPSLVMDYNEEKTLVVGVPQDHGTEVMVSNDTPLLVELPLPDGLRRFQTTVLQRVAGLSPGLVLTWPREIERIQRRDFFRVDVERKADVSYTELASGERRTASGWTIDLSGGGVRLALPEPIPAETPLSLRLFLQQDETQLCDARVIRSGQRPNMPPAQKYWVACQFIDPSEAFQKEIVKLVFDIQREQMRRA